MSIATAAIINILFVRVENLAKNSLSFSNISFIRSCICFNFELSFVSV